MTTKISMSRAHAIYACRRAKDQAEAMAAAKKLRTTTSSLHRPVLAQWASQIEADPSKYVRSDA